MAQNHQVKNPYSEIFQEIESGLIEHMARIDSGVALPYEYDDNTFRACLFIFMQAMLSRASIDLIVNDIGIKSRIMEFMGSELKDFVFQYTGIDTAELYKQKGVKI